MYELNKELNKKKKKRKEEFYCVNSKMFDDKTIETKIIIKR